MKQWAAIAAALCAAALLWTPASAGVEARGIRLQASTRVAVARPGASTSAAVYYRRGVSNLQHGNYKGAIIDFNAALRVNHRYASAYFGLGNAYYAEGRHRRAIAAYTHFLALTPHDPYAYGAYYNRALNYDAMRRYRSASADYTRCLSLQRRDANAYLYRGLDRGRLGNHRGAVADVQEAERLYTAQKNSAGARQARAILRQLR